MPAPASKASKLAQVTVKEQQQQQQQQPAQQYRRTIFYTTAKRRNRNAAPSSITLAVNTILDEEHVINYIEGIDELVDFIQRGNIDADDVDISMRMRIGEAARSLRKKLKYGSVPVQLHTLHVLDVLIERAGSVFRHGVLDDTRLWKRLRRCASADSSSPRVREKCRVLFYLWHCKYTSTPGLERLSGLHYSVPGVSKPPKVQKQRIGGVRKSRVFIDFLTSRLTGALIRSKGRDF
ncbi:VHS domain-containing protein [Phlyctema vagabunda]|uniref:VHS domain-containing protein n=1 Tax=Phlyctema vagabunda TaxID=108571 RepID=A0ABR4PB14_9HELO